MPRHSDLRQRMLRLPKATTPMRNGKQPRCLHTVRVEKARTAYEHWRIYLANGRSCPAEKSCSVKQIGKCSKKKSIRKRGKTIINRRRKPTWKNPIRRKAAEGNEARFTPGQRKGRILLTRCLTEALKRWRTRWFLCFFC